MRHLLLTLIFGLGLALTPHNLAMGQTPGPSRGPGVLRGGGTQTEAAGVLPEPATIALLAITAGGGSLFLSRRRRRNRKD
jgi:hypothetical protein